MKHQFLTVTVITLFAIPVFAGTFSTDGEEPVTSTDSAFRLFTKDESKPFQLGGLLQWDYDLTDTDSGVDTEDFDARRARLYAKGYLGDWAYKAQINIADTDRVGGGGVEDLYVRYTGFGQLLNITAGKQKEPFGLEELTRATDISALERSALTELYAPGRSGGIQWHGKGDNWSYDIGVFEADVDSSSDFDNLAVTGRVTYAPWMQNGDVIHLGAGFTSRDADSSADEVDTYNFELAGVWGPFHIQIEHFESERGGSNLRGHYLQVGWIITGESRPYKDGRFQRVEPIRSSGAWEMVYRFEDDDGRFDDIGAGTANGDQTTIGLNYYVTKNVRLGLSYMDGEARPGGSEIEGDEVRVRIQITF